MSHNGEFSLASADISLLAQSPTSYASHMLTWSSVPVVVQNTWMFGQTADLMIPGMHPDLGRRLTTVWLSVSLILPPELASPPLHFSRLFLLLNKKLFA